MNQRDLVVSPLSSTFVAVTVSVVLGRVLVVVAGKRAEIAGGLLFIGAEIVVEHLSAG